MKVGTLSSFHLYHIILLHIVVGEKNQNFSWNQFKIDSVQCGWFLNFQFNIDFRYFYGIKPVHWEFNLTWVKNYNLTIFIYFILNFADLNNGFCKIIIGQNRRSRSLVWVPKFADKQMWLVGQPAKRTSIFFFFFLKKAL